MTPDELSTPLVGQGELIEMGQGDLFTLPDRETVERLKVVLDAFYGDPGPRDTGPR